MNLVEELVNEYKEKIVVSIDAKDGKVAVRGWEVVSDVDSLTLCKQLEKIGVQTIVYTDISKDGMLQGPNFDIYERIAKETSLNVIASGGVTSIEDVKRLKAMNLYGAIIGKALYDKKIDFKEAQQLCLLGE
ncbi:1-(5-phosphoribosyl)-5-[(5-phosphoribosylamino)methylideneamino] imidazole-4-carboxamide isomerase [Clostridioides difficile]|nr:1-(5-phosphoribosyl)-5-[(5-phosphoribosylamino)methylideneamino] imidazole-4-carboxamide isomerase [Clostridioides difficile]